MYGERHLTLYHMHSPAVQVMNHGIFGPVDFLLSYVMNSVTSPCPSSMGVRAFPFGGGAINSIFPINH